MDARSFLTDDERTRLDEQRGAPKQGKRRAKKPTGVEASANDLRPTIKLVAGEIGRIVDEAELALIKANRGLYQRDGRIVFVSYTPAKTNRGEDTFTIQILDRGEHALIAGMAAAARFERFDKRSEKWFASDPPILIVKALQEHALGKLRFPVLYGVVTAPTMRADGSILSAPGYDAPTGLLFDSRGIVFPAIPERPTRADAERAFATLGALIKGFPFVNPYDWSVAMSAILTACVRRSLPAAPLHAFSAPVAGTGKGKLVDIACVIATGFRAAPLNAGIGDDETEKRLASKLMTGEPFIALDNCTRPLGGDLLCSMLTQEKVSPRILGVSKAPSISTGSFNTANGNGLIIKGDLTRRSLLSRIDAKIEQPESRRFDNDPVITATTDRANLVVAALTILRAYHVAGRPDKPPTLGSFEAWSDLVRGALMWLGAADPVDSMKELRKSDPVREAMRALMGQWLAIAGNESLTCAEIIRRATDTYQGELMHADFRDALIPVASRGGALSGIALGKWLESKQNTIVDGLQFVRMGERAKVALWAITDG
jgi:putative DNA primase/helicase